MTTIDDRHAAFKSDCAICQSAEIHLVCEAYPNGIPEVLYTGVEHHTDVRTDQVGDTVFQSVLAEKKSV